MSAFTWSDGLPRKIIGFGDRNIDTDFESELEYTVDKGSQRSADFPVHEFNVDYASCLFFLRAAGWKVRSRVIMTTYHPVSENLKSTEPGNGGEAEGNCVAVNAESGARRC